MGASHVQVAPDGSGKDIDTDAVTSTESGNPTVYRQDIVVADPITYNNKAGVTPEGYLQVDMRSAAAQLAVAKIQILQQQSQSAGPSGFVPVEIPTFLGGF